MNAVSSRLRPNVNHRIPSARRLGVEDLVFTHETQGKCIYERIPEIALLELGLAAEVRYPKAVAVRCNPANNAFEDGMVLVNQLLRF